MLGDLIKEGKQLICDCMVDRGMVIKALKEEMKYTTSSEDICANCQHSDNDEYARLNCYFNELFPFNVNPGATCAQFKSNKLKLNI